MERKKQVPFYWTMLVFLMCLLPCFVLNAGAEDTITNPEPICYEHGDVNSDGQVDSKDAVYVLYHHFFAGDPGYAVSQDCDFDKDGKLTAQDAVYVLYGASGGELAQSHPLGGTVHQYYTPTWSWTEDAHTQVILKCGCGQNLTLTEADGITVQTTQKPATCVDAGSVTYEATLVYSGETYTDIKKVQIPAVGHTMAGTRDCENGSRCVGCNDYTLEALGHNWVLDPERSTAATCSAQAVQVYKCAHEDCGQEKKVALSGYAQHAYALTGEVKELENCRFQQILKCACGEETLGDVYERHVYTAALTREATCQAEGEKTFTCICGDSYTEAVPRNDSHNWNTGSTEGNITTYSCDCGATKTAVRAEGSTANVTREDLAASTEVQINDVAISLNENTISKLDETVQIQVKTTTAAALPVAENIKQQIGNNPVYDFSLTSGENIVSDLGGSATIQVPYTLQPGDDVDCIDIWFISDDGVTTCVQGTYSNGYVTFTTDHFSYYTVTRLTPAQRCETYGHAIATSHMDATCVQEGYHKEICQRCGYVQADKTLEKIAHDYQEEVTQATCTADGSFEKTCSSCHQTSSGTIPALGHNWQKDENQSVAASCEAAGKKVYVCANGCGQSYTEELPQLKHDFGDTEESEADCDSQGHKKRICKLCGYEDVIDSSAPTGHDYLVENAVWEWEDDYSQASVTLVCTYNKKHTKTFKTVVTSEIQGEACQGTAKVVYTAAGTFNKTSYTDVKTVPLAQEAHQPEKSWQSDASRHYRVCENCGEALDSGSHVWGQQIVTQAATCSTAGSAKQSCSVCDYTRTIILEATGEHNYVNGICQGCGFAENSCGHIRTHKTPLDLSGYDICDGADIQWVSCDCGEVKYLYVNSLFCNTEYSHREETLATGETDSISTETCNDCGLVIENHYYGQTEKETCQTREVELRKLFVGDQLIASGQRIYEEGEASGYHIANIRGETVDISPYGDLCGVVLQTWHCSCGKISYTDDYEGSACKWRHESSLSTDSVDVFTCRVCGAVRKHITVGSDEGEDCTVINTTQVVYEVDGQQIYSTTNQNCWIRHDYEVTETQLDGASCTDGVYLKQICRDCGKVHEQYVDYHITAQTKKTVLEGFCSDTLVEAACACGENKECYLDSSRDSYCQFHYEDDTATCQKCGLSRTQEQKQGQKDENCRMTVTSTITYQDKSGRVLAVGESVHTRVEHDFHRESTLLGKDCEDGVKITQTCQDCGFTDRYTSHSHVQVHTRYDLSQYGLCGGELVAYGCACGKNGGYYTNNGKCLWIPDKKTQAERCSVCGVTRTETRSAAEILDICWEKTPVTITYSKGTETLLEVSCFDAEDIHRYVYTMDPFGTSCEDGYQLQQKCLDCGKTSQWESNDEAHGTYAVSRKWLSQGSLCGDAELVTYSCGCGQITSQDIQWRGGECVFDNSSYLGEGKGYISVCSQCGVTKNWTEEEREVEGSCFVEYIEHATFSRNATELFRCDLKRLQQRHNNIQSFQLFGTTCRDGFRVTSTCSDCGRVSTSTVNDIGGCAYWGTTGLETLYDGEGICGPVVKRTSGCPCGNLQQINISDQCSWEIGYWDGDTYIRGCSTCGVQCLEEESTVKDPKNCKWIRQYGYTYRKAGAELLNTKFSYSEQVHEYTAEFELLGKTCEDGYYVTQTCVRCGDVQKDNSINIYHNTYPTEYYDLQDYGLCGGSLTISRCACGQQMEWSAEGGNCYWSYTGETDDAIGLNREYCAQCDTYRILGNVGSLVKNSCDWNGTFHAVLDRNGETLLKIQMPITEKRHQYVMEDVILYDADQGCEGGYHATMQCQFCDTYYESSGYDHSFHNVEHLYLRDLYGKACDGYVSLRKCACGIYTELSNNACNSFNHAPTSTYEGTDGYTHTVETRTCTKCGLVWTEDYYLEPVSNSCAFIRNSNQTLSHDGQTLKSWTTRTQDYQHETVNHYSLMPGSVSCEDGLKVTTTCKFCDYETSWYRSSGDYNHDYYNPDADTSIDLTEYGSVCGGKLVRYVCACGKQQRYDFDQEALCDIDRVNIGNWVPGSIDEWHYTTQGHIYTDSESWLLTCAVTDPDCGLKIRMSEYWLEENCAAVEYQTWQLGYDEITGTCQREFTVKTGDRHAYHPYQHYQNSTLLPNDEKLVTDTQECPQCGSSYVVKNHYNLSGSHVKHEEIAVNTLNNGENKQFTRVYEYGKLHAGYRYETLYRYDVIYADGSAWWENAVYEYDFTDGCFRTRTYTNSDGGYKVSRENAHVESYEKQLLKSPTCSQFGQYRDVWYCQVCKEEVNSYTYDTQPIAHSWLWNDSKQFYECGFCGLENINGASGEIVLEDLTDSYGKGSNYVVGYWNRGNVEALRYVSVVLTDAGAGENDELVLTDITFTDWSRKTDGITAVVFSRKAVNAAAAKAVVEAGYTGSYAIRFTFVPKHAADTLDYAITFDDLKA